MYIAECAYRPGAAGLVFLRDSSGDPCDLRVAFRPVAYYPAEPDIGAGADFDAAITSIEIRDWADAPEAWHTLEGSDLLAARRFLDRHFSEPMWAQAEAETLEALGATDYRRAA